MDYIIAIMAIAVIYFIYKKVKGSDSDTESDDDSYIDYNDYFNDLSSETMSQLHGQYTDDDHEKYGDLLKKSTALKKKGDLDSAIIAIDEALKLYRSESAVYKKASYQYLNKQRDKGWKTMTNFHQDIGELILKTTDWKSTWRLFSEYTSVEEDLVKLLKKEKKIKDVAYWLPGSVYARLVQQISIGHEYESQAEYVIDSYANEKISDTVKNPPSEFNIKAYDKAYKDFVLSKKADLLKLSVISNECEEYLLDSIIDDHWIALQEKAASMLKGQRINILKINKLCSQAVNT
jgi:tetratricopeptide (TPR) repeat protein